MTLISKALQFFKKMFHPSDRLLPSARKEPLLLPPAKEPLALLPRNAVSVEKQAPKREVVVKKEPELGWVNLNDIRIIKIWAIGVVADHCRVGDEIPYDMTEQLRVVSRGNEKVLGMYAAAKEEGPLAVAEFFEKLVKMCDEILEAKKNQGGLGMNSPAARQNQRIMDNWRKKGFGNI